MKNRPVLAVSFLVSLGIVVLAFTHSGVGKQNPVVYEKKLEMANMTGGVLPGEVGRPGLPRLGKAGSAHTHVSLVVFVNNEAFDFFAQKYMLRSDLVHFENDDGVTVHKHATGVTVPYFFKTLGMELTKDCLKLDDGERYCTNEVEKLSFLVNGVETDPDKYEIGDGDKVLINYGTDDRVALRLKMNSVPDVSKEILKGEGE